MLARKKAEAIGVLTMRLQEERDRKKKREERGYFVWDYFLLYEKPQLSAKVRILLEMVKISSYKREHQT